MRKRESEHLKPLIAKLAEMGFETDCGEGCIDLSPCAKPKAVDIKRLCLTPASPLTYRHRPWLCSQPARATEWWWRQFLKTGLPMLPSCAVWEPRLRPRGTWRSPRGVDAAQRCPGQGNRSAGGRGADGSGAQSQRNLRHT